MAEIRVLRSLAIGCLELGSIAVFIGALWVWAAALSMA